jgi:SAM-dependent methyltransferase/translation initiation factor 1 (eIF-1/SUI1)
MQMLQQKVATRDLGASDASEKLERLEIPKDLSNQAILDIGCGEGFYCGIALARGASRAVGVDVDPDAIDVARQSHPNGEFFHSSWTSLPLGPFDVVQWISAMHFERDPAHVFENIYSRLSDDGLFILECGTLDRSAKELVQVQRQSDTLWYPTIRLLTEVMLEKFTVRCLSYGVIAEGDPIPRYVFHCRKRLPTVALIRGESRSGKSALSDCLSPAYTKILQLDMLVSRIAAADHHHTDLQKLIRDLKKSAADLGAVYRGIDSAGMAEQFARMIAQSVAASDKLVIIEGAVSDSVVAALAKVLKGHARFWRMERES